MKVTPELSAVVADRYAKVSGRLVNNDLMQAALEIGLADVPDWAMWNERAVEAERKLDAVREAHTLYQSGQIDREEFEGAIAEVAEGT